MNRIAFFILTCILAVIQINVFGQNNEPPVLISPAPETVFQIESGNPVVTFNWQGVEGATGYLVNMQIRKTIGGFRLKTVQSNTTTVSVEFNLGPEERKSTVNWAVLPLFDGASGSVSSSRTFSFDGLMPPPQLLTPVDGASFSAVEGINIEFTWSRITGASGYQFSVYRNNEIIKRVRNSGNSNTNNTFQSTVPVQTLYQWEVRSIDQSDVTGLPGKRRSFTVGAGEFPTPTPFPVMADMNEDGEMNSVDVYLFTKKLLTNDPSSDFDQTGITDVRDLLRFIEMYQNR